MADVFVAFSIRMRLFAVRHMFRTRERKETKKKKDREEGKKRRGVTDQKQNASKCGWRGEDREHERGITGGHPRCPPALPDVLVTQSCESAVSQFVGQHRCATSCRYDMTRDGASSLWNNRRRSLAIVILNSRIWTMFLEIISTNFAQKYSSAD